MESPHALIATALRCGRKALKAARAGQWEEAMGHIDRRTEAIERLGDADKSSPDGEGTGDTLESQASSSQVDSPEDGRLESLMKQQKRLRGLLEERQEELRNELERIDQIEEAQSSYKSDQGPTNQVLPDELSG